MSLLSSRRNPASFPPCARACIVAIRVFCGASRRLPPLLGSWRVSIRSMRRPGCSCIPEFPRAVAGAIDLLLGAKRRATCKPRASGIERAHDTPVGDGIQSNSPCATLNARRATLNARPYQRPPPTTPGPVNHSFPTPSHPRQLRVRVSPTQQPTAIWRRIRPQVKLSASNVGSFLWTHAFARHGRTRGP